MSTQNPGEIGSGFGPMWVGGALALLGVYFLAKKDGALGDGLGGIDGLDAFEGECPSSLQPLIQWPGGKRMMAKRLVGMMPEHETYVEPFIGGGSVFFAKPLASKNVISDMDPWIIGLYKDVQAGKLKKCEDGIKPSKGLFGRSLKSKDACHKVALSALSFHGNRKSYYGEHFEGKSLAYVSKLGKQRCYAEKLSEATVKLGDFAKVMKQHDSPSTLHFLDPPWPMDYSDMYHADGGPKRGKSRSKKAFGGAMDPEHVRKVADGMKGTVMVIYNWTPELADVFRGKGWTVKKIQAPTGGGQKGTVMKPNLLAIKKAKSR